VWALECVSIFPFGSLPIRPVSHVCPVNRSSLSVPLKRPLSLYYFSSLSVFLSHPPSFLSCWDDHCVCIPLAFLLHHAEPLNAHDWGKNSKLHHKPAVSDPHSLFSTVVVSWKIQFLKLKKVDVLGVNMIN